MKYVYLLKAGENHYKVGVANNVTRRVSEIQTSNPNLIEVVTTRLVEDSHAVEQTIHLSLKEMKANGGKEWFELTPSKALDLAIVINRNPEIDLTDTLKLKELYRQQSVFQKTIDAKLDAMIQFAQDSKEKAKIEVAKIPEMKKQTSRVDDEILYQKAKEIVIRENRASTSMLQRRLTIGYGRAARIIDRMEYEEVIGKADGIKPRRVLIA